RFRRDQAGRLDPRVAALDEEVEEGAAQLVGGLRRHEIQRTARVFALSWLFAPPDGLGSAPPGRRAPCSSRAAGRRPPAAGTPRPSGGASGSPAPSRRRRDRTRRGARTAA